MRKRIQVGNLHGSVGEGDLEQLFAPFGRVRAARLATHTHTGRRTGVGFVEMASDKDGEAAVAALNGREHLGQVLSVCWGQRAPTPRYDPTDMFGPMNTPGDDAAAERPAEHRGLPAPEENET